MRKALLFSVICWLMSSVEASDPGQPLDCSDWVSVSPGITCTTVFPYPCSDPPEANLFCSGPGRVEADNLGRLLMVRRTTIIGVRDDCPGWSGGLGSGQPMYRTELVATDGTTFAVIGYIDDRCNPDPTTPQVDDLQGITFPGFDSSNGKLFVAFRATCTDPAVGRPCAVYSDGLWLAVIDGFTSIFDITQTYNPSASTITFTVPVKPETLPAADRFDTYWGSMQHQDVSQAQGLRCNYPTAIPAAGDFLEVVDSLPDPPVGNGYYFVTAVTHLGETRYGRNSTGGQLSGRDPTLLPQCAEISPQSVARLKE